MMTKIVFIIFAIVQAIFHYFAYNNFISYKKYIDVNFEEKMLSNAERLETIVEPIFLLFLFLWLTWSGIQFSKNIFIRFWASLFVLGAFVCLFISSRYFSLLTDHICK